MGLYSAKNLWNARTKYVGNNSAVSKLIGLLPVPEGLQYDHFALQTSEQPYDIEIVYLVPTQALEGYDTESTPLIDPFRKNALLLLALVENAEGVRAVLTDGTREVGFIHVREWADYTVGGDVRDYAATSEALQKLIDLSPSNVVSTSPISFWVKPDESAQVIGNTAANMWLDSFIGTDVPKERRISSYKVRDISVISATPKEEIAPEDMKYQYVVQLHYDITTATEDYYAPGDGVTGAGKFENLYRELYVRHNTEDGGSFEIVSIGTDGGAREFAS